MRNSYEVRCVRCPPGAPFVPPEKGYLYHPPGRDLPYVVCPWHALLELVPEPAHLPELLASFPRSDKFNPAKAISPYPYQAEDARRIASMRALLIGSQMGTGKTPTAALGALRADVPNLIFCPASVKWNWKREVERWRPDLAPLVAGSRATWRAHVHTPGVVTIASWGLLPGEPCKGCKQNGWRSCTHPEQQANPVPKFRGPVVLLADEVQYLQRPESDRRHFWELLKDAVWDAFGRVYGLTGTVISNSPNDLKEILRALNLYDAVFRDDEHFLEVFREWFYAEKGERKAPTRERREELLAILRPVRICRLRKHVLKHLPPVQEKTIRVDLTTKTLAQVDEAVQRMLASRRAWEDVQKGIVPDPWGKEDTFDGSKHRKRELPADERARRMAAWEARVQFYFQTRPWTVDEELRSALKEAIESRHETPHMTELARIRSLLALAKLESALELVERHEAEDEPLLVFCQHVGVLEKLFSDRKGWGLYSGAVPQKKRDELVQAFGAGDPSCYHGLGVSITAGGEGINLTRAGSVVFVDAHWNPAKNDQAAARVIRPGAEIHDSITIWRLVANHAVDRLLYQTLAEKGELHMAVEDDEASMAGMVQASGGAR